MKSIKNRIKESVKHMFVKKKLTDNLIFDAVNLWVRGGDSRAGATKIYGPISEWDVSNVTDMSYYSVIKIHSMRILVNGRPTMSLI